MDNLFTEIAEAIGMDEFIIWVMNKLDDLEVALKKNKSDRLEAQRDILLEVRDKFCEISAKKTNH